MRIFTNFDEALNEIKRDLAEMGVSVHTQSMQDKYIGDDPEYATLELQNYSYTVTDPVGSLHQLNPTQPWADIEFSERIQGFGTNPGEAYHSRADVWLEFLHDGKFAYTYSERIGSQLHRIITELHQYPDSRQLYLSIWDPNIDNERMGSRYRVPCSLGYLFQLRGGQLNVTYMMRSCDFVTHFQNDVYLGVKLMQYIANVTGYKPGYFTHSINSLHIYQKDVEGVF
jgi:thymidylate synthase